MARLFDKQYELIIGDKIVTGLRIAFKIAKDDQPKPDKASIRVFNLSRDSRARLAVDVRSERDTPISLSAGYGNTIPLIFNGVSRKMTSKTEGSDWVTIITAGDGEGGFRFSRIQESLAKGASMKSIAKTLMDSLEGVNVRDAKGVIDQTAFRETIQNTFGSKILSGPVVQELTTVLKGFGLDFTIQDNQLVVVEKGKAAAATTIPLIAPGRGLLGSPEAGEEGRIKVVSQLNADLKPLFKFKLESRDFDSEYKAIKVTHDGDTHGDQWSTTVEANPL